MIRRCPPSPLARLLLALPLITGAPLLTAADAPPAPAAPPPAATDPTAAVVAQGAQTYHQRDVDALALLADRYVNYRLTPAEEDQLHKALARLLVAREPLLQALQAIPPALVGGKAGDAFLLDVLDYHPEPLTATVPLAPPAPPVAAPPPPNRAEVPPAVAAPASGAAEPPTAVAGAPVIAALPPLTLSRTIQGEKRQVVLGIALCFADETVSQRFQERAPLIRDTILTALDGLSDGEFCEPKQSGIKRLLQGALEARLADFPKDGVLIPQLDAGLVPPAGGAAGAAAGAAPAASTPGPPPVAR